MAHAEGQVSEPVPSTRTSPPLLSPADSPCSKVLHCPQTFPLIHITTGSNQMWGSIRYFNCHVIFLVGIATPGWPSAQSCPPVSGQDLGSLQEVTPPEQAGWEPWRFQLEVPVPPKTGHLPSSEVTMETEALYRSSCPEPGLLLQLEILLNLASGQLRIHCWRWLTSAAIPHRYTGCRCWSQSGQSHNDKASGLLK